MALVGCLICRNRIAVLSKWIRSRNSSVVRGAWILTLAGCVTFTPDAGQVMLKPFVYAFPSKDLSVSSRDGSS